MTAFVPTIPASPAQWTPLWAERIANVLKQLVARENCTGAVTLDPVASSTTLTDFRIHPDCVLAFMALTSQAVAVAASIYVPTATIGKGVAVVQHTGGAGASLDFRYAVLG